MQKKIETLIEKWGYSRLSKPKVVYKTVKDQILDFLTSNQDCHESFSSLSRKNGTQLTDLASALGMRIPESKVPCSPSFLDWYDLKTLKLVAEHLNMSASSLSRSKIQELIEKLHPMQIPSVFVPDASQAAVVHNSTQTRGLMLINGGPGSGKTQTLVHVIKAHLDLGHKIVYLTFDSKAKEVITQRLQSTGIRKNKICSVSSSTGKESGVCIATFDLYALERLRQASIYLKNNNDLITKFQSAVALGIQSWEKDWDVLCVDEVQDIRQRYSQLLEQLITTIHVSVLAGDPRQEIYAGTGVMSQLWSHGHPTVPYSRYVLQYNYRSSPDIIHFLNCFSQTHFGDLHCEQKVGQGQMASSQDQVKLLVEADKNILAERAAQFLLDTKVFVEAGEAAAISTSIETLKAVVHKVSHFSDSLSYAYIFQSGHKIYQEGIIFCGSPYSCKGAEFAKVCLLISDQELCSTTERFLLSKLLFVAASRAKHDLLLIMTAPITKTNLFYCTRSLLSQSISEVKCSLSATFNQKEYAVQALQSFCAQTLPQAGTVVDLGSHRSRHIFGRCTFNKTGDGMGLSSKEKILLRTCALVDDAKKRSSFLASHNILQVRVPQRKLVLAVDIEHDIASPQCIFEIGAILFCTHSFKIIDVFHGVLPCLEEVFDDQGGYRPDQYEHYGFSTGSVQKASARLIHESRTLLDTFQNWISLWDKADITPLQFGGSDAKILNLGCHGIDLRQIFREWLFKNTERKPRLASTSLQDCTTQLFGYQKFVPHRAFEDAAATLACFLCISHREQWPALVQAAFLEDTQLVHQLLEQKYDPNLYDSFGYTALTWCSLRNNRSIAKLLLQARANVDPTDYQGYSPFIHACFNGHTELCLDLLEHGAKWDLIIDQDGWNGLHHAFASQKLNTFTVLSQYLIDNKKTTKKKIEMMIRKELFI